MAVDSEARTVDVKKPAKLDGFHPAAGFGHSRFPTDEQSRSILRLADWIVANGMDRLGDYRATRDLLLRNCPRLTVGQSLTGSQNEDMVETACRVRLALDNSVLPIQGPPGAGKTCAAAHMICRLVARGEKVGVTAVGHKVIRNLLDKVQEVSRDLNIAGVRCGHRIEGARPGDTPVREIGTNDEALRCLQAGAVNVLGATPWL